MDERSQALARWYARHGLGRGVRVQAEEVLGRWPGDGPALLWRAHGLVLEQAHSEALRVLAQVQAMPGLSLAASYAALHAHQQCRVVDEEAVHDLELRLASEEEYAEQGLYEAAEYCWLLGDADKARYLLDRLQHSQQNDLQAKLLEGWLLLEEVEDELDEAPSSLAEALNTFNEVLAANDQSLEALMGKARCYERQDQTELALNQLMEANAAFPWFLPAKTERARLLLKEGDWDQMLEVNAQVLAAEPDNVQALYNRALHALVWDGNAGDVLAVIGQLIEAVEAAEPKNHKLMYSVATPLARGAGKDPAVLELFHKLMAKALQLAPGVPDYLVTCAYIQQVRGHLDEAAAMYENAGNMSMDVNTASIEGVIHCLLLTGDLDRAADQLEFLNEMGVTFGKSSTSSFLDIILMIKRGQDHETVLDALDDALADLGAKLKALKMGAGFLAELNPNVLLDVVGILLDQCGSVPRGATKPPMPLLKKVNQVLQLVARYAPCIKQAKLFAARSSYLNGDMNAAQRKAQECLRRSPTDPDCLLLLAQIFLHQGKPKSALQAMENAVSHDFAVRELPQYTLVRAHVHAAEREYAEVVAACERLMALPGFKALDAGGQAAGLAPAEKASVYVMCAETLSKLGEGARAEGLIQEGMQIFESTPEAVRLVIAHCKHLVTQGKADFALKRLGRVPLESPHFLKAKIAMADIYLRHKNDKQMYAECYMELVEKHPDAQSYCVLGEAYMQIHEPAKAVTAYENALRLNPRDSTLTSKIGKALLRSHDFQKAIDYYESSIRNSPNSGELRYELARLYLKMNFLDHSEKLAKKTISMCKEDRFTSSMITTFKMLKLLSQIAKKRDDHAASYDMLEKAEEVQAQIVQKVRRDQPDIEPEQREVAAQICFDLGKLVEGSRQLKKALHFFKKGLEYFEADVPCAVGVARVYRLLGEHDLCASECHRINKKNGDNEEVSMMLADLTFSQGQFDQAVFHFSHLLEKNRTNYTCLENLIRLLFRTGRRGEIPKHLADAERHAGAYHGSAGLSYCKGLHEYLTNNPYKALGFLNAARKDEAWGTKAIELMVNIYLNPDKEILWDTNGQNRSDFLDSASTCSRLLKELKGPRTVKQNVLEAYALMVSRVKQDVEAALGKLIDIFNQASEGRSDNVPVLLAMAVGFLLINQTPKARNQLKRISKLQFCHEDAEEFERAWLTLVELYIQGGKFDMAQELCRKCLTYNQSCAKAWEHLGAIMEQEQAYQDAAEHYHRAWHTDDCVDAHIGFKLAFNYLKAKRYVEAIDVCRAVLDKYPDYPKIRREILEKAQAAVRA